MWIHEHQNWPKFTWNTEALASKLADISMAKCSNDTALRNIQELKERGIFIQNTSGGRSTSYRLIDSINFNCY